ncbi:MAG: hypothetical protein PVJ19_19135, partial [Desulfobacteraceae bacterium]
MEKRTVANKLICHAFYIFTILLVSVSLASADVPINIFPNNSYWAASDTKQEDKEDKINTIINENFYLDEEILHKANVKVQYSDDGSADHLVVYLLSKTTYSADTYRVNLNEDFSVDSIISNYKEQQSHYDQDTKLTYATCPDDSVDMVFSTAETSIPTALAGINTAVEIAESQGYNVEELIGSEENTTAIKNWLACDNLILYGRIGHGDSSGIVLDDGYLNYSYFQGLSSTALNDKAMYFNSCEVHNNPLEPAIVDAGVQKFVGGDVELLIGTSEEVFKCWMQKVIVDGGAMTSSLASCEDEVNYQSGAHGISGDGSDYLSTNSNSNADTDTDADPDADPDADTDTDTDN